MANITPVQLSLLVVLLIRRKPIENCTKAQHRKNYIKEHIIEFLGLIVGEWSGYTPPVLAIYAITMTLPL